MTLEDLANIEEIIAPYRNGQPCDECGLDIPDDAPDAFAKAAGEMAISSASKLLPLAPPSTTASVSLVLRRSLTFNP